MIKHIRTTQNAEERLAIHRVLQHANNPMVATDKWQLSPEELERVKETGTIHLSMQTFNQPLQPVLLTVDLPTEK